MRASSRSLFTQNHSPSLSELVKEHCGKRGDEFKRITKNRIDELAKEGLIKEVQEINQEILKGDEMLILPEKYAFPFPISQFLYHDPDISSKDLEKKIKEHLAEKKIEKESELKHEFSPRIPAIKIASVADQPQFEELTAFLMPESGYDPKSARKIRNPFQTLKLYSKDIIKKINSESDAPINKRELPQELTKWFSIKEKLSPKKLYKAALEYAKNYLENNSEGRTKRFVGFKIKGAKGNYFRTYLNLSEQGLALASHPFFRGKIEHYFKGIKTYNNTATGKVPSKEYFQRIRSGNLEDAVYKVSLDYLPIINVDCDMESEKSNDSTGANEEIIYHLWRNFNGESSSPLYLYDKSFQSRSNNPKRSRYKIVDAHQIAFYHSLANLLWRENKKDCKNNPLIINDTIFPIYSSKLTEISDKLRYKTFILSPQLKLNKEGNFELNKVIRKLNEFELEYILMNYVVIPNPELVYLKYSDVLKGEKENHKSKRISQYILGK